jgi:RNA polymerase sigma-70 factor (ECF subfamily)
MTVSDGQSPVTNRQAMVAGDTPSDEELAKRCQAGSLAAFEELVYRYEGRIYRFVANSCLSEADAREVTQETFIRAFQALAGFDSRRAFAPWLFTIAHRKRIDHHRSAPPAGYKPIPAELADSDTPAELLSQQEERATLWATARRCLPELQFQTLWLRYTEEMDVSQIARVLKKTKTHVKVLLFRARQTLGYALKKAEQSPGLTATPGAAPAVPNRAEVRGVVAKHFFHEKLANKVG